MIKRISFIPILITFALFFLISPPVFPATINVPGDYSTVQAAIDAASSGDLISVSPGIYNEAITLADNVNLKSITGASETFLDGDGLGDSVVTMESNSTLDGFTVRNGTGQTYGGAYKVAGGIFCNAKDNVTIQNCIIDNNTVTDTGVGILGAFGAGMTILDTTNSTLSNCTFSNNEITSGNGGGAIAILSSSGNHGWTITNCIFDNNTSATQGGAILVSGMAITDLTFTDCTFSNNTASGALGAGAGLRVGMDSSSDTLTFTLNRCTFYNNTAGIGAGAYLEDGTITVTNCLFYSNTQTYSAFTAGGLRLSSNVVDTVSTVTNCTFANNTGSGIMISIDAESSTATVKNCSFYGNSGYGIYEGHTSADATPINCLLYNNKSGVFYDENLTTYSVEQLPAIAGAINNIDADPRFIDSDNNNYHLQALSLGYSHDSPCIDTGRQGIGAPTNDLDGNPRPQGSEADIGCYEASSTATRLANLTKAANRNRATYGDIVTYSLTIKNTSTENMVNTTIRDTLPKGIKYIKGTAKLDNTKISNPSSNRRTKGFSLGTLLANTIYTLKYKTVIGAGSSYGRATNRATLTSQQATDLSPTAEETITIIPNPLFNASTIIGKVFHDTNQNGYQDKGELGLFDVTLITEDGFMVTTDAHGRYHIDGLKPQTKVIAVMTKTLPKGYTLTTPNPVLLKLTPALTLKANFGVYVPEK